MPMFPDSGVPANEAKYSLPYVNKVPPCDELWYSTARCQPRFDPAAANAMLAEDINLIMKGEIAYDCVRLDHIERAVRYINQRGLPRSCYMYGGPSAYWGGLDPPVTRYNDYLTLSVVPNMNNIGPVTFDVGLGAAYILRNDGTHLEREDLKAGRPLIIIYYGGYWFVAGLVASQVPIIVKGGIDCWIRTDGNDTTGDRTANTPNKAFRTIKGCWAAVGSRYAATPLFSINMRLGIPGDYEAGAVSNFGGNVSLTGDPYNFAAYRILSTQEPEHVYSLVLNNVSMWLSGVNLVMRHSSTNANANNPLRVGNASVVFGGHMQITLEASSPTTRMMLFEAGAFFMNGNSVDVWFQGNGCSAGYGITMNLASSSYGTTPGFPPAHYHWQNINFTTDATDISDQAVWRPGNTIFHVYNTTGKQYSVSGNGVLDRCGQTWPGSTPGSVSTQGQVF
jgi:hypothetical protein